MYLQEKEKNMFKKKTNFEKYIFRYGQPLSCPGTDTEKGTCNDKSCLQWTEWGPWSSCSVSCGKGGQKSRYRKCKSLDPSEIYNNPTSTRASGLLFSGCDGKSKDYRSCESGPCKSLDCSDFPTSNKYYSFAGRPASSIGKLKKQLIFFQIPICINHR